jgi:two-component system NtrC family sensor kinase
VPGHEQSSQEAFVAIEPPKSEVSSAKAAACTAADSAGGWDAEAAVAALVESVPCGILLFGRDGELRAVNEHFAQTVGCERTELLALGNLKGLIERLAPGFADPAATAERWLVRRQIGEACWDELELVSPNRKHLERFARQIVDLRGQPAGWMEVYRDVTGQKLAEGNLFHIERMVTLGQLVSSVAHELSNPLTSLLGYAQLLRRRRHTAQGEEDVEHILQEAERASRLARSLLQFGRGGKPERCTVGLNDVVRGVLALRANQLALEEIEIHLELDPHLVPVLGDAAQLQQVLLNLVVNAEQAIRQGVGRGSIRLRTRRASGNRLAVEVIDDGPGIAPEVLPRIFDPFFTTKPTGIGTGLGLSIAYGIVHDHGGSVSVESHPGCGAAFAVELPVAPAPPLAAGSLSHYPARELPAAERTPVASVRSEQILVIEDEPAVARLIADVLTEEGHRIDVVLDSREGARLIGERTYGLVLCDLRMPHLSGRSLFHDLQRRAHPLCRRFVFVTGDALSPNTMEFLKTSGVPHLAKPFLIDELKEVVHRALCRTGVVRPVPAPVEVVMSCGSRKGKGIQR